MRQLRINLLNPFHTELAGPSDTTKMDNEKTDSELKRDRQTNRAPNDYDIVSDRARWTDTTKMDKEKTDNELKREREGTQTDRQTEGTPNDYYHVLRPELNK